MEQEQLDLIKKELIDYLSHDKHILAIYLLGSILRDDFRDRSDIDIALLMKPGKNLAAQDRLLYMTELQTKCNRVVDLGVISSKNLIYATEAIFKGEVIYTNDQEEFELYKSTLISMYFQLNIDRKEILDAYRT